MGPLLANDHWLLLASSTITASSSSTTSTSCSSRSSSEFRREFSLLKISSNKRDSGWVSRVLLDLSPLERSSHLCFFEGVWLILLPDSTPLEASLGISFPLASHDLPAPPLSLVALVLVVAVLVL